MFISFEGIDGSGKSTQIQLLLKYFDEKKIKYIYLREPGGTDVGEQIREIVLSNKNEVKDFTEVMLYATSRSQLVEEKIIPSLEEGLVVVCDRYVDSSIAYQSVRDVPFEDIMAVNRLATRNILPDVTFLLNVPATVGLGRVKKLSEGDRIEQAGLQFFEKVVQNYEKLAKENKDRFVSLDGQRDINDIHKEIIDILNKNL